MLYYLQDNDGKIITYNENQELVKNTLECMPQYKDFEIKETDREIVMFQDAFYFKDEILDELRKADIENHRLEIEKQLEDLDKKRIRAICEPSLKDEETTWLEFYNAQIAELRNELSSLS